MNSSVEHGYEEKKVNQIKCSNPAKTLNNTQSTGMTERESAS